MLRIKNLHYLLLFFASLFATSCNVHEWPEEIEESYDFILYLDFDTDLPLYKEVYYTRGGGEEGSRAEEPAYDIRYIINIYQVKDENDATRTVWQRMTFTRPFDSNLDYSVKLSLPKGNYRFRAWADFVDSNITSDKYYNTDDFVEIFLKEENGHQGSTDFRDAFKGTAYGEVYDAELYEITHGESPDHTVVVDMQRPMGRFEFISTDMDEFLQKQIEGMETKALEDYLARAAASRGEDASTKGDDTKGNAGTKGEIFWHGLTRAEVAEAIGLNDYTVKFSYNAFMPSSYNLYTDKPSDSLTGVTFNSKMDLSDEGMTMGFDYVFTDSETTMNLKMELYNKTGEMVSSVNGVEVPIMRSKNTIVKGDFLTVTSGGGVSINPDFDGDYDIEIH